VNAAIPALTPAQKTTVLQSVPLADLLAELERRALNRPFTGIPRLTARTLVDMFEEDCRADAVLLVATAAQVAIAYEDRTSIEDYLGREFRFTDAEWDRVWKALDDLCEALDRDVVGDWIHRAVRAAGIDPARETR
jgi:hypothetical protein